MPNFITFLPGLGEVSDRFRDPDGSTPRTRPRPGGPGLETETRDLPKGLGRPRPEASNTDIYTHTLITVISQKIDTYVSK